MGTFYLTAVISFTAVFFLEVKKMNVALVHCKKSADRNCMGSCLKTYAEGVHPGEYPAYYFHCGGCDSDPLNDEELAAKIRKMQDAGVTKVHFTTCVHEGCPNLERLQEVFEKSGWETEFAYLDVKKAD